MNDDIGTETLTAFLDGELSPEETARVAALLVTRPDLDAWVNRQQRLRASLRDGFAEVIEAPVPAALAALTRTAPISWRWRMAQAFHGAHLKTWVPAGAALVAGLAIGIAIHPSGDLASRGGQVVAQSALADALDRQLASAGDTGGGPHIGVSFRNRSGRDCRTFTRDGQAGLACHDAGGWVVNMLVSQPREPDTAYQMAGSALPDAIRNAVAASIQGAPFDAAAEKAARDKDWR
ncbi:MAG TPA: hypothetical protein VHZ32_02410 [Rhizomicrobium sp.]|jgi:hypothetical protein|nr:hypothetical protein [Rhizomicrobium sp.]